METSSKEAADLMGKLVACLAEAYRAIPSEPPSDESFRSIRLKTPEVLQAP